MRKIIHCDFDCFFAAVEVRDNPTLANKAIAIGGDENRRGVIATCSYEARQYGVRSAMATATAKRLCPKLIIIKPNMAKYRQVSRQAQDIFKRYSNIVEPLSLDEAFLDVSNSEHYQGSATRIAQAIRDDIQQELSITASAGIAPNKFLAKIASDWRKPNGQFVIPPENVEDFVKQLPVNRIFGVGKVTEQKMRSLHIHTCEDLRALSQSQLKLHFGKFGDRLFELCRGEDTRPVNTHRLRKSLSVEHTYADDLTNLQQCCRQLPLLHQELLKRISQLKQHPDIASLFIKLKFSDFQTTVAEKSCQQVDLNLLRSLLRVAFDRNNKDVRLMGLGVRLKPKKAWHESQQLDFWGTTT